MSNKTDRERLQHIHESCEYIFDYTSQLSKREFMDDQKTIDSVIRRFEIIGEACAALPAPTRQMKPEIAWSEWIGFRNLLIHQYPGVKNKILWMTIQNELKPFQNQITELNDSLET